MPQYDNNLRGVLFKNDEKRDGRKDPDYRGQCEIDGTQYWLSAWIKESQKDGRKFMSLSFQPKQAKDIRGAVAHKEPEFDDDKDLPF